MQFITTPQTVFATPINPKFETRQKIQKLITKKGVGDVANGGAKFYYTSQNEVIIVGIFTVVRGIFIKNAVDTPVLHFKKVELQPLKNVENIYPCGKDLYITESYSEKLSECG